MVTKNIQVAEQNHGPVARVPALDLLRLVAVLGVILFHYGFRGPNSGVKTLVALPDLAAVARYGYLGVPVFFIISGFVIAYSARNRSATEFAIARFARIYPTFVLCLTLTWAVTLVFGAPHFETGVVQWLANLAIASPALGKPYMDPAYWSLVTEVTFYAWVAALIAWGLFPACIDAIVLGWLGLSILNEVTIDAALMEKIFLCDYSGFFATGLLIHEFHRGRRDTTFQCLLATAIATAVFQAIHNLAWLRDQTGTMFNDWIVAAICLGSIWLIVRSTQFRSLPLPTGVVLAIGGLTYPLYLLHQKLGYVIVMAAGPGQHANTVISLVILGIIVLSWLVWRLFEHSAQPWTKQLLIRCFDRAARPACQRPRLDPST